MSTTESAGVRVTGVITVGIPVNDQDRALDFYVGTLGLEKHQGFTTLNGGWWITVAAPGNAGTTLALVAASEQHPAGVETEIRLATTDAVAAHEALGSKGVAVEELLRWPGVPPMFRFRDPDGNVLELVEMR